MTSQDANRLYIMRASIRDHDMWSRVGTKLCNAAHDAFGNSVVFRDIPDKVRVDFDTDRIWVFYVGRLGNQGKSHSARGVRMFEGALNVDFAK